MKQIKFDPGKLHDNVEFLEVRTVTTADLGTEITEVSVMNTRANVALKTNGKQLVYEGNANAFAQTIQVVIRNRSGFYPEKDMLVIAGKYGKCKVDGVTPMGFRDAYIMVNCSKVE